MNITGFQHNTTAANRNVAAELRGGGVHDYYLLSCSEDKDDIEYLEYYNIMINSFINSSATTGSDVDHPHHPTTNHALPPLAQDHDHYQDPVLLYLQVDSNSIDLDHHDSSTSYINNSTTCAAASTTNADDLFPLNGFNLLPSEFDNFSVLSSNDQSYIDHHNLTSFSSSGSSNDCNYYFNSSSSASSYNCLSSYNCHYPKRHKTSNKESSFYFNDRAVIVDSNPYLDPNCCYDHFLLPPQLFLPPTSTAPTSTTSDHSSKTPKRSDVGGDGSSSSQSLAARQRRKKITDKTQELKRLIPGGDKMNTADMYHAAYKYIKFLQAQLGILELMTAAAAATRDHQKISKENSLHTSAPPPLMGVLLTSTAMHEKLFIEEKCLVSREFIVDMLTEDANPDDPQADSLTSSTSGDVCNSLLVQLELTIHKKAQTNIIVV